MHIPMQIHRLCQSVHYNVFSQDKPLTSNYNNEKLVELLDFRKITFSHFFERLGLREQLNNLFHCISTIYFIVINSPKFSLLSF